MHTGIATAEDITAFGYLIERIQVLWSTINPSETVTLKLHGLSHILEAMSREGHAGREVETVEHARKILNTLWPKYASVMPLSHRLFIIVSRFNSKNTLSYH